MDKSNTQLKLIVSDLKLKLRTRDKEMSKEMQKVSMDCKSIRSFHHQFFMIFASFLWSGKRYGDTSSAAQVGPP